MVVDNQPGSLFRGSLYVFWYRTGTTPPYYFGIQMRYSRDGGRTWSGDVQVSDLSHDFFDWNPIPVVGPGGILYVAYEYVHNNYIGNESILYLARSTDGGRSWSGDRQISGGPVTKIGRPDYKKRELTLLGGANCTLLRIHHFPSIAVSPFDINTLYAVWNDGRWEPNGGLCGATGRHSDIAFSRSTDGGNTWTAPARINDDPPSMGIDQFSPTLAVRSDGLLAATWYDRRYSYYSHQDDIAGYDYDLVYAQSADGGLTWSPNTRVSDYSSQPDKAQDFKGIDDLGFRKDIVFTPGHVLASWMGTPLDIQAGNYNVDRGTFAAISNGPAEKPPAVSAILDIIWPFVSANQDSRPSGR
jgi:hypothetical protein